MSNAAEILAELELAVAALASGNEGRARVCARRAAGLAARDFLARHQVSPPSKSQFSIPSDNAYEALKVVAVFPRLSPRLKTAAHRLIMRVSEEFQLPRGIDLIDEARKLIGGLND